MKGTFYRLANRDVDRISGKTPTLFMLQSAESALRRPRKGFGLFLL